MKKYYMIRIENLETGSGTWYTDRYGHPAKFAEETAATAAAQKFNSLNWRGGVHASVEPRSDEPHIITEEEAARARKHIEAYRRRSGEAKK